ncbi:phosphatase PAP2 family protein [Streptomyces sp. NPDC005303]|uniref:phosphatase PAP2 family protein n=1 Tax=Streptomyces sp. NPDC005303 TaxID=3155713 RepID=UPI0033AA2D1E
MRTERNPTRLDRVFARLDREPERPANLSVPRASRHRTVLAIAALAFYLAIVWLVVTTSWLVRLDWQVMFFRPYQQWASIHWFVDYYVVLGQRGPTAVMVAAWLGWRSWRQHTLRPLLTLGASLLLLNITVGAAKYGMGRLGPHYATVIGSNEMGLGGDIFPSGHTANAVVTWGILAYLASTPRARRWLSAISAVTSLGVGMATVYLGTHWLSDVLLGWIAGLLILLALPWFEPLIARTEDYAFDLRDRWRARGGAKAPAPVTPVTAPAPARLKPLTAPQNETAAREAAAPARGPRSPAHLAPGPHSTRSERAPVTPLGSRRPPHPDRIVRGTPSPATRPVPEG